MLLDVGPYCQTRRNLSVKLGNSYVRGHYPQYSQLPCSSVFPVYTTQPHPLSTLQPWRFSAQCCYAAQCDRCLFACHPSVLDLLPHLTQNVTHCVVIHLSIFNLHSSTSLMLCPRCSSRLGTYTGGFKFLLPVSSWRRLLGVIYLPIQHCPPF